MSHMVEVEGLVKRHGKTTALAGVDLAVRAGTVLGLLLLAYLSWVTGLLGISAFGGATLVALIVLLAFGIRRLVGCRLGGEMAIEARSGGKRGSGDEQQQRQDRDDGTQASHEASCNPLRRS